MCQVKNEYIHTIIDSQCDNIFLGLLGEDFFQKPALKYLAGKAHPDIRSHFAEVLAKKGHDDGEVIIFLLAAYLPVISQ